MFTGIVQEIGVVKKTVNFSGGVNKLRIECKTIMDDIKLGDSISVSGICLTVSDLGKNWIEADVMPETLSKTSLSSLKQGSRVNLEPALRLNDRMGGHIVTGHIDGIGTIKEVKKDRNALWIIIETSREIMRYIIMKGSICIEGTSLTVADMGTDQFSVSLIPMTTGSTTLGEKKTGDKVNIECDILGKYVEKMIIAGNNTQKIDKEFLAENGFL